MPKDSDKKPDLADALMNFLIEWKDKELGEDEADEPEDDEAQVDREQSYKNATVAAVDAIRDGEAFMLVSVKREQHPARDDFFTLIPDVVSFYKTDEAGLLVETQLSQIVALVHQEVAGHVLTQIMRRKRGDGEDASD